MMTIDEKKFNRLWTISRYVYGLYPIIVTIFLFLMIPKLFPNDPVATRFITFFSNYQLITIMTIANGLLGILILTRSPRLGAYLIAALGTIGVLVKFSQKIELSDFIFIFAYLAFGLLTEIKETANRQ